jgi:CrcB protein
MTDALTWIGIGALGAVGAYARFWVGGVVTARWPGPFPLGTLTVNLSGGFALGLLIGLSVTGPALLVLGTGLLGGYTTFSTWMVEAQRLGEEGDLRRMLLDLAGPMFAGLAATGLGWLAGGALG